MNSAQYALMASAVDEMADAEILGAPKRTNSRRAEPSKPRARKARAVEATDAQTVASTIERNDTVPDDIDENYRQVFAALSESTFEELMLKNGDQLNQILEVLTKWWNWDKNQMRTMRAEARERERRAALEETARQAAHASQQGAGGSNTPLTDMVGDLMGGADVGGRRRDRKTRTKTRKTPGRMSRAGTAVKSTGSKALHYLGKGGKWAMAAALASAGALGLSGVQAVSEGIDVDVPERTDTKPKTTVPETVAQDVQREKAPTKPEIKADGLEGPKKQGFFKRMAKGGGKLNMLLATALAAKDLYDIGSDDTMTKEEKNKAYSGTGGGMLGGLLGGMGAGALGAALGQVLIPIPGVGAAIGGAVGTMAGGLLGSEVGSSAGEMVYDVVVREDDVKKEEEDNTIKVKFDSPELKKIADAAEAEKSKPKSWWDGLFGGGRNGNPTVGSYASGNTVGMSSPGTGYGAMRDNMIPRTSTMGKLDYTNAPGYVAGQGVLKSLPQNDKAERNLSNFSEIMEQAGAANNVDPMLLRAVTWQESRGNANATSGVGAAGLMQLMPGTAGDLGVTNRYDPKQSIHGGAKYLAQLTKRYNGNVPLALAAYNGGMGNIDKAIKKAGSRDPEAVLAALPQVTGRHSKETIDYVHKITAKHNEYRAQTDKMPEVKDTQSVAEVQRTQEGAKPDNAIEVKRETSVPTMLAAMPQPAPAAPAADAATTAKTTQRRNKQSVKANASARVPSMANVPTLDDMPLILTEQGLGNFLMGEV